MAMELVEQTGRSVSMEQCGPIASHWLMTPPVHAKRCMSTAPAIRCGMRLRPVYDRLSHFYYVVLATTTDSALTRTQFATTC